MNNYLNKGNRGRVNINNKNKPNFLPKVSKPSSGFLSTMSDELFYALLIIITLAIMAIVTYVIAFSIKYGQTKCRRKKPYFKYLFGFCWNNVCDHDLPNEVNNTYYMKTPPVLPMKTIPKDPGHVNTDLVKTELAKLKGDEQVFNIANQDYTYDQARCKCASYNAKLATYEQVVEAYNKGAEWCAYGWSEGQNAFYPTQKCTWDALQEEEHTKNNCGKPGINGGFFADPNIKFGANCYGKKPEGKIVKIKKPSCGRSDNICGVKANKFATKRLSTDEISPFNENSWYEPK
jgi:hypothetical protein